MILESILVFCAAIVVDVLWALYIRRTAHGQAGPASVYATLIFLAGAYNTLNYLQNPWLLIPIALGSGVGTYVVVRYEHRKAA